ncbi:hypothetical protein ACFU8W_30755 [Streptomyces sp. NPDC057565]|uniref:hypothetical protein n=1 Tax=Streptomyces sp. NPDC057565 TaxID=3346169 RepID=UPI00368D0850
MRRAPASFEGVLRRFPRDKDGWRWDATAHDPATRVRIQEVGHVKVHQHRPVAGRVKTVPVEREDRKRFVVLTAEQAAPDPLPTTGSVAGIDLGTAAKNRPTQDTFHCTVCGHTAHADTVGTPNALRAGPARRKAQPA